MTVSRISGRVAPTPYQLVVPGAPTIVPSQIAWTDAELRGWDSYCPAVHAPFAPALVSWSGEEAKANFRRVLMKQMVDPEYSVYKTYYTSPGRINMMAQTLNDGSLPTESIMSTVSWTLVESYVNNYRGKGRGLDPSNASFDMSQVPWLQLPNVSEAMRWFTTYLDLLYAQQCIDINKVQVDANQYPQSVSLYGFLNLRNSPDPLSTRDPMWNTYLFAMLHCHYAHLLSNDRLLLGRKHVLAAFTALRIATTTFMPAESIQISMAQWLNAIVGAVLCAAFLVQSESILAKQGISVPTYAQPDWTKGQWTSQEAVSYAEDMCTRLSTLVSQHGSIEFAGAYLNWHMLLLCHGLTHACSARAFFQMERVWMLLWKENISNYLAPAGCLSGPTARCYNLFDIQHQSWDHLDAPLYINSLLRPNRTTEAGVPITDPFVPLVKYVDSESVAWHFQRNDMALRQLGGGMGLLPEVLVDQILIQTPRRVTVERHGKGRGQVRYNYLTEDFSIGNCGMTISDIPISSHVVARFSPTVRDASASQSNSIFRLMVENMDNPFAGGSVPGNDVQLNPRLVSVQQKNVLLVTSLAYSPGSARVAQPCLNSNLFVPLNVDSVQWVASAASGGAAATLPISGSGTSLTQMCLQSGDGGMLIVRRDTKTFIARLLIFETDVPGSAPSTKPAPFALNSGKEPYSLMWQVGADERASGVGRIILHHRHTGSNSGAPAKAYRVAWLLSMWSNATTGTSSDTAIAAARGMTIVSPTPGYKSWDYATNNGTLAWGTTVTVPAAGSQAAVTLSVQRTDTYCSNGNDRSVYDARDENVMEPPICTRFDQRINGVDVQKIYQAQGAMTVQAV